MGSDKARKIAGIVGLVMHVLIGGLLIFAGSTKLMGMTPAVEALNKIGMGDKLGLLGAGELFTGLLLIVPLTCKLGTLATSGFWGGVISIHMSQHDDSYMIYAVFLALTWLAAFLRTPEMIMPMSMLAPKPDATPSAS